MTVTLGASDLALWLLVAMVAFLLGQGRVRGLPLVAAPAGEVDPRLVQYRGWCLAVVERHYNLDELATLAFDVGVNWELISGETLSERGRELILYCERVGALRRLLDGLRVPGNFVARR